MSNKILLSLLLTLSLAANGCWDKRELTDLAFVQVLGLDIAENSRDFRVSCLIADSAKSNPDEPIKMTCIVTEATSIYDAFNSINSGINRELTLLQNQAIIIGEKLAAKGFAYWNQDLSHFRDLRHTSELFFCEGTAEKILQATPKLESEFGEHLFDLSQLSGNHYILPPISLHDFTKRNLLKSNRVNYGNYLKSSAGSANLSGMLVFKDNSPVGLLTLDESQLIAFFREEKKETLVSIDVPHQIHGNLLFNIFGAPFSFKKINYFPERNLLYVKLRINAVLEEPQRHQQKKRLEKTEAFLNSALKKRFTNLFEKSQTILKCDIFNLASHVRRHTLTDAAWEKYKWSKKYPTTKIKFDIETVWRN